MLTVEQGYSRFLQALVPTATDRQKAAAHRASVQGTLDLHLNTVLTFESGSFRHGTGVRGYSDVDVLVWLKLPRPTDSDTALSAVRAGLKSRFPYTPVQVRRPAVRVEFAAAAERWEVIPAYLNRLSADGYFVYDIPGPNGGWITTAPKAHLDYVNASDGPTTAGATKKLARLLKAWKYFQDVPVSSFYLEMRAAEHIRTQRAFLPVWDVSQVLNKLSQHQLAAMNDPMGVAGRILACSSPATRTEALSKLATATRRANAALEAHRDSKPNDAFAYLRLLYGDSFPARWS